MSDSFVPMYRGTIKSRSEGGGITVSLFFISPRVFLLLPCIVADCRPITLS